MNSWWYMNIDQKLKRIAPFYSFLCWKDMVEEVPFLPTFCKGMQFFCEKTLKQCIDTSLRIGDHNHSRRCRTRHPWALTSASSDAWSPVALSWLTNWLLPLLCWNSLVSDIEPLCWRLLRFATSGFSMLWALSFAACILLKQIKMYSVAFSFERQLCFLLITCHLSLKS